MKKFITVTLIGASFLTSNVFAQGYPVFDLSSWIELGSILAQAEEQYTEIQKITADIKNWQNLSWDNYRTDLNSLLTAMHDVQSLTTDVNKDVSQFQALFPGYNTKITDYNKSFSDRNSALLNILQQQVVAADQAYRINSSAKDRQFTTAAAIAQEELSSLRDLNVLIASESKTESAYRANHMQEKAEDKQAVEKFIGTHEMQQHYNTQVGEGQ